MRTATKAGVATAAPVAIAASLATALLVGGTPATPPQPIPTPTADAIVVPGYASQTFRWQKVDGATGYKVYLDGIVLGNVPGSWTGATLSVKCGAKHRFNVQPFNNKGAAPLAPPVYVTIPAC